jgi:ATP-binding cassette subfamily F protein 1
MENFIYEKFTYTYNSISIQDFKLSINEKLLFDNSSLSLNYGNCYGLIGKNGCGKSTLLKQFNKLCDEDKIKILYLDQELILDERTSIQYILDSNIKIKLLQERVNLLEEQVENMEEFNEELYNELYQAQSDLSSYNPDKEESLIKKILTGLGFTKETLEQSCNLFSGGWQMRISLARCLYLEPDLLLLDEPTNHLDLEAIIWLGDYLSSWKKIAIIVSHNIGFINSVCDYILNVENNNLISYKGNYHKFKKSFENKMKEYKKEYEKYEKKLKEFKKKQVTKNQLDEFNKKHLVKRPEKDYNIVIPFLELKKYLNNIINFDSVSFSYPNKEILNNVSFGLSMESKVTLVGLNGSGKSTIIKLIMGDIKPLSGEIIIHNGIRIGYYNQHFDQQLPFDKTPIEFLTKNKNEYETIRSNLGKIKLESSAHNKLIGELSGGQKARVAIIKLILDNPHILLLDEPTNHLDIETVEALISSLQTYSGGILLITHEPELINSLETELWIMNNQTKKIDFYNNTYESYCEKILL